MEEARAETHACLALDPTFTVGSFRLGAESDNPVFVKQHERSADIMRKAGHAGGMSTARVLAFAPNGRNGLNLAGHDLRAIASW
jgi:hypothetical protein